MLARIRKSLDEKDQGFTLIELLVVMIIIGILAAIAIPVFLSQRAKARDTATKADVSTVGKEIATYFTDGTGTLTPTITGGGTATPSLTLADGTAATAYSSGAIKLSNGTNLSTSTNLDKADQWCISLTNTAGKQQAFKYSAAAGLQPGSC